MILVGATETGMAAGSLSLEKAESPCRPDALAQGIRFGSLLAARTHGNVVG